MSVGSEGKVVALRGGRVVDRRVPNALVVREAEGLLEMARSGEISGFVVATATFDGAHQGWFVGDVGYTQIGRLEELKVRMLKVLADG